MRFPSTGLFSQADSRHAMRGQTDALKREIAAYVADRWPTLADGV